MLKYAYSSLGTAFRWGETKEGNKYWNDLYDNVVALTFNIPAFKKVLEK